MSVIRSASSVPRPTRIASAFRRNSSNRAWSSREVQPDGRGGEEEIFPSAEMARFVEMRGRGMPENGRLRAFAQTLFFIRSTSDFGLKGVADGRLKTVGNVAC